MATRVPESGLVRMYEMTVPQQEALPNLCQCTGCRLHLDEESSLAHGQVDG